MAFRFVPHHGGSVIVGTEIANNFAKLGHNVTVLTPDLEVIGEKYLPFIHPNVKIIQVQTPSRSNIKIAARRCKTNLKNMGISIAKKEKFDFIFTIFHPFHLVPNAAIACAKELGIPAIVKIDDAIYQKSTRIKSIQRKIEKIISSRVLKNASRILVVNENTKQIMNSYYNVPYEKMDIIPNGVDLSFFKPIEKINNKIIFSGVMYHHRGLDILLKSLPNVVKKNLDVKVNLFGDGPEMIKLQNIVKEQNLQNNVEFKGWINRDDLSKQICDASIGIGPLKRTSVTENALPIKVLEYMASSLPILAINGTLPNDVLVDGENGFFVNNSEELSEKINYLLKNPQIIETMGNKSIEMVQKFAWDKIVLDIIKKFENLKN